MTSPTLTINGASPVVSYDLDDGTVVRFEVEPTEDWFDVSTDQVLGRVQEAVAPAIEGAKAVLAKAREAAVGAEYPIRAVQAAWAYS